MVPAHAAATGGGDGGAPARYAGAMTVPETPRPTAAAGIFAGRLLGARLRGARLLDARLLATLLRAGIARR